MKNARSILIMLAVGISMILGGSLAFAEETTPSPTLSVEATPVATPAPTPTPTSTPTIEQSNNLTISPSPTPLEPTPAPVASGSFSPSPTPTPSPALTPTGTPEVEPPREVQPQTEKPKDNIPPQTINDLRIEHAGIKSADISWTAPFDNNGVNGYDIRISLNPINEANWLAAIQLPGGSAPHKAGEKELITLGDLPRNATIYAAVRSHDSSGNMSGLSNVIQVITRGGQPNRNPAEANIGANSLPDSEQKPLSPINSGVVRLVLQIVGATGDAGAEITVPEDLIFVNFINQDTGVSLGGAALNGVLAIAVPAGRYSVKLILPPHLAVADALLAFEVRDGVDVDLGVIRLISLSDNFAASVDQPQGVGRALGFIIKLLFEILK